MTRTLGVFFALSVGLMGALTLSSCTPTVTNRGHLIEESDLKRIKTGFHTYSDVLRFMGSPTTKAPFDRNVWYYIQQKTEKRGILDETVVDERIIQVTFNDKGVVQNIDDIDSERINIPVSRDKTKTHGNEYTFMQQLLGNVGRFNTE